MAEKTIEMDVPETVTINAAGTNRTFFKGRALVSSTDKQLIERELEKLEDERQTDEAGEETDAEGGRVGESSTVYTRSALNKMSADELVRVAKGELGLAVEENATKGDLVKLIYDAQ